MDIEMQALEQHKRSYLIDLLKDKEVVKLKWI